MTLHDVIESIKMNIYRAFTRILQHYLQKRRQFKTLFNDTFILRSCIYIVMTQLERFIPISTYAKIDKDSCLYKKLEEAFSTHNKKITYIKQAKTSGFTLGAQNILDPNVVDIVSQYLFASKSYHAIFQAAYKRGGAPEKNAPFFFTDRKQKKENILITLIDYAFLI